MLLFSCSKEQPEWITNSIVNADGQISKNLVNDPLYKKFDKANYEMKQDFLKYAGEKVDWEKSSQLNKDLKAKKFKTFREFEIAQEKIGYRDYHKRTKTKLYAILTKEELFQKYPELKTLPLKTFLDFHKSNSRFELTPEDFSKNLEKIKKLRT
jgi:hypothetical protein